MDPEYANFKNKVKKELADFLGVEVEDIDDDSSFSQDLHMGPTEMTDFLEALSKKGMNIEGIDMSEIETFEEFTEALHDKH